MGSSEKEIVIDILTKEDCCLCKKMKALLKEAQKLRTFEIREVDVAGDEELLRRYGEDIPVVFINGRKAFKYRMTIEEFLKKFDRLKGNSP